MSRRLAPGSMPAACTASFGGDPVTDRLIELARRIQARPWNASGSEKTWVLDALRQHQLFAREVREARRADAH